MDTRLQRVGFVGVGTMGRPMAERLVRAGHQLTVCDTDAAALEPFVELGTATASAASASGDQDIVLIAVATDAQLVDAVLGPGGLVAGVCDERPPLVAVMSTVQPATIEALAQALARKHVRLIDAPVSGGPTGAEAGTLSIMVGGAASDLAEAEPILAVLGQTIFHCGELGAGALTKIVNNLLGVTNTFLLAEALELGWRYGLDIARLSAIMEASSGRNVGTKDADAQRLLYRTLARTPQAARSIVEVCRKDLSHAVALARAVGMNAGIAEHMLQALSETIPEAIFAQWNALGAEHGVAALGGGRGALRP